MKGRLLAAVAALLLAAAPARAQSIDLRVDAGWDGAYVEDAWVPLHVVLTAPAGSPPVTGRVSCEPVPQERVPGSEAPFALAPTRDAPATAVVFLAVPARGDFSFTVVAEDDRGRELARSSPRDPPRHLDPKDRLVLLVGRRSGLIALESAAPPGVILRPPPGVVAPNRAGIVRVARIGPEDAPDRSWVLAAAQAVFLAEGPGMVELARDEARVAALESYVRAGATLVVVGGRGVAFWAGSPLEALLPVKATGKTASARARDFGFIGIDHGSFDVPVSQAEVRKDVKGVDVIAGDDARPLAVRAPHGRGEVVFVAFDPDNLELRGAPDLPSFLARLVPPPHPKVAWVRGDRLTDITARALQDRPPLGPLGLLALGAALAVALVIFGPVAARRKKAPARILVAPGLAALLALVVVIGATLARPATQTLVFSYAFAESEDDQATLVQDVAVVAGGATKVSLELEGQATLLPLEVPKLDLLAFRTPRPDLRLDPGRKPRVANIPLAARGLATFRAGAVVRLPWRLAARRSGPTALELEALDGAIPDGLALREDTTTHALLVVPTPALRAGEKASLRVEQPFTAQRSWDDNGAPLWERPEDERARALLVRLLDAAAEEAQLPGPQKASPRAARTWVALPVALDPLARVHEGKTERPPAAALGVALVAAEDAP